MKILPKSCGPLCEPKTVKNCQPIKKVNPSLSFSGKTSLQNDVFINSKKQKT